MKISDMLPSKYIKQGDVPQPMLVTIRKLSQADVSQQNESEDLKWTVKFDELDKPMVLNSTNLKRTAKALGDDTDAWIGKQMVLYVDENVEFGGEIVGGLRLRAPKTKAAAPAKALEPAGKRAEAAFAEDGAPFDDALDF